MDSKAKEFIKEYEDLCKKHGLKVIVVPVFKPRDDGTWSVVLQSSVVKLNVEEKDK